MSTDNKLYGWGNNEHQTLSPTPGRSLLSSATLCTTFHLPHASVIQVGTGFYHVLALTDSGKVFSWGGNQHGQLGNFEGRENTTPREVVLEEGGTKAMAINAGDCFSVALTEEGEIYTWGQNIVGQLGRGGDPKKPGKVPIPKRIKKFAIGEHVIAVTEEGGLFVWGHNNDGQLGLNNQEDKELPVELHIEDEEVVEVACGTRHTLALTRAGNLYSWGDNFRGQLALGDSRDRYSPTRVFLRNIVAFSCGWKHCLALANDGSAYGWGNNESLQLGIGQVGQGSDNIVTSPHKIPPPSSSPIASIICGWDTSYMITLDGSLYAAGNNASGRLGIVSEQENQVISFFVHVPGNTWKLPLANTERKWREVLSWLFLGRSDKNSELSGLPPEVLFHMTNVLFQAE
jgi:alpha-tubulin suppressor-like RCC1 family protein